MGTSVNAIADRETSPWADATYLKDYLRDDQYRSDANLRARQAIYSFQEPRINLPGAVIDLANPADDDVVMDIGCGNGAYLAEIARRGHRGPVIGIDLSTGMLETARQAAPAAHVVAGDASSLPLRKGTARLVLAAHMLYHVADPMTAISECRRALAGDGRLVVVLNDEDHLHELREAVNEARRQSGVADIPFSERLRLDEGEEMLSTVFSSVVRRDFEAKLVLDDLGPAEAFIRSLVHGVTITDEQRGDCVRLAVQYLSREPRPLTIRTHTGCLVCS